MTRSTTTSSTSSTSSSTPTPDPVALFDQLVREVDAARTLLVLATVGSERRRAALDALALARDVLVDAEQLLAGETR